MGSLPLPTCCIAILLTLSCHLTAVASISWNFTDIQKLGKSCPQLDSCAEEISRGFPLKDRNCACDHLCLEYGDCCIDAPGMTARTAPSGHGCFEMDHLLDEGMGIYMKDSCPPSYDGPEEIRAFCESETTLEDSPDPLGSLPATNRVTGMTFKNYYCAICNGQVGNMTLWSPKLVCPSVATDDGDGMNITSDVVYQTLKSDNSSWGFYLTGPNGSVHYHNCVLDPMIPAELESMIRLCKSDLVSDCPPDWEDEDTRSMCRSYMAARFVYDQEKFRNPHCAVCNGRRVSDLSCQFREMKGIDFRKIMPQAFSLLLDVNEAAGENVGKEQRCDPGDVWDMFFRKCRSLLCLPGYKRVDDSCVLREEPAEVVADTVTDAGSGDVPIIIQPAIEGNEVKYDLSDDVNNSLQNALGETYNASATSENVFKGNLSHDCLLIALTDDEFVKFPNESIYVPRYDKVYESTNYHTRDGKTLVCSHFGYASDENKFLDVMGYLTLIGLGISMLSLFLHFVMFWIVPDLQNLSGKCLVSLCVVLFVAYASYIIGASTSLSESSCILVGFLKYYFFQGSFFWMAVIAYDVWRTLKMATTELRVSSGRQMKRFAVYSLVSWGMPLALTALLAMAEFTDTFPVLYRPGFACPTCWFVKRRSLATFFFGPLVAIMLMNVVLFVSSSRMILLTTQSSAKQQRRNFKLYLRLALLMGLTWVVGLVASFADLQPLWYLFCALNTLQGVFICIAFTFSSKVLKYLRDKLRRKAKPGEFRSTTHSASTGSGCLTNSTRLHSSMAKKLSSKLLLRQKDSASTHSTSSINASCQTRSPI